jgi:hypothetical protein
MPLRFQKFFRGCTPGPPLKGKGQGEGGWEGGRGGETGRGMGREGEEGRGMYVSIHQGGIRGAACQRIVHVPASYD